MKIGMHLPVRVPGLDRDRILDWSRRIDRGPYSTLAARERMDRYLMRYLNFMGLGVAEKIAATVTATSSAALRDGVPMLADLGADEVLLTPTHDDPDDVDRVADLLG